MQTKNLAYIETLRGLAILGVLMVHTTQLDLQLSPMQVNLLKQGAKGVQLFFIASAFTLFLSLSRRQSENSPYLNFFIRRFFRIAPMYWLGIAVYGVLHNLWLRPDATKSVLLNLTFLHGFDLDSFNSVVPGGWSIAVEMAFYVMVPILFRYITSLSQAIVFTGCCLLIHCGVLYATTAYDPSFLSEPNRFFYINHYLISSLPVFGMGITLFFLVKDRASFLSLGVLVASVLCACFVLRILQADYLYLLFSLGFVGLAYVLNQGRLGFLNHPALRHIGKVSFSLYLVHFAVLDFFRWVNLMSITTSPLVNYSVCLLLLLLVGVFLSTGFYRLIEIPFQKMGKQLIQKLERQNETNLSHSS